MVSNSRNMDYSSVPSTIELENNSNQNKYTVNQNPNTGVTISKLVLCLMALGVLLLIGLAIGLTILLYPTSNNAEPQGLINSPNSELQQEHHNQMFTRLPNDLSPLHYRLQLVPFLEEQNFTTSGIVTITLDTINDVDKIVLNAVDIIVDETSIKVRQLNTTNFIPISDQNYNNISEIFTIHLKEKLIKGNQYDLDIKFTSHLRDKMQGFYRSNYYNTKLNSLRNMASTQFSPTDARRAFPCFDEPSFKSKFTISIGRLRNMTTLSNMPKRATDTMIDKENWEWDHYLQTPKMSTYLVAFVVSELQAYRYNSSGRLFTVHTRLNSASQTRLVLELSPRMLEYYENYFKIPFPLPKIDLVAVPDFGFSAMENWGLITSKESIMLYDESTATIEDQREIVTVLAHELGHQWFGNLVTPAWWNDLWLKEGFANYVKYLAVQQTNPSWNIQDEYLSYEIYSAFTIDYYNSSHPITFDVVSSNDIRQMFDSISYSKGASIIRMVNHIIGEENMNSGLSDFLNKHQYGNVEHDDLWNALEAYSNKSTNKKLETTLKEIMDSWILKAGFPVVTAIRNYTTGDVALSQKRFLLSLNSEKSNLWWVPISYATDLNPQFNDTLPKFWLSNEHNTITINSNKWWLLNLQQTGYYIVNYDEQNWRVLLEEVTLFPPIIRVQLISDSMNLARANVLDYDIPLRMLTNIATRDENISFITNYAALNKVQYLYEMLVLSSVYKKFENYLFRIYNRGFETINFNENPTDGYIVQRRRRLFLEWSCRNSASRCTNDARVLFRQWVENLHKKVIRPNVLETILCTAIREGDQTEWDLVFNYYTQSTSVFEKNILLNSLGCSQKPWILNRYLDEILKKDTIVRKQDSPRVFKSVANNPAGHSIAFTYLRSNWIKLNDYFGPAFNIISKMVAELPVYMNTPYQLKELIDFRDSVANDLGSASHAFEQAIERVKTNVEWMNHSYNSIVKWLNEQSYHYGF